MWLTRRMTLRFWPLINRVVIDHFALPPDAKTDGFVDLAAMGPRTREMLSDLRRQEADQYAREVLTNLQQRIQRVDGAVIGADAFADPQKAEKAFGFTYRGVPGGAFGDSDQLVLSSGAARSATASYREELPGPAEWAYLTHPTTKQSLFLIQHTDDALAELELDVGLAELSCALELGCRAVDTEHGTLRETLCKAWGANRNVSIYVRAKGGVPGVPAARACPVASRPWTCTPPTRSPRARGSAPRPAPT